jgi:hypothetical protein
MRVSISLFVRPRGFVALRLTNRLEYHFTCKSDMDDDVDDDDNNNDDADDDNDIDDAVPYLAVCC